MIAIDTIAVEDEIVDNMYQRSELDYLIYNDPIAYANLILNGDPETYLKTVTEYLPLDELQEPQFILNCGSLLLFVSCAIARI